MLVNLSQCEAPEVGDRVTRMLTIGNESQVKQLLPFI